MTYRTVETAPQVYARLAGFLYLMIIIAGALGEIAVRGTLIVPGDAAATANNIMTSQSLWRIGVAGDITMHVLDIPLMLALYVLLRPVHKNLAVLAVLFNLIQTAVLAANKLNLLMPLFFLDNVEYLKAFGPQQMQALAYLSVKAHGYGFGIGLIFFGFTCLVQGYLIFRSDYLPKAIGVLMQFAGLSYLTNSFAMLLAPGFAAMITPQILLPPFLAEVSLSLWLIVKGVNIEHWRQRALQAV